MTLLDMTVTLLGQPGAYWRNYNNALEMAPHFDYLLQQHPVAFLAGVLVWILGGMVLIRVLPGVLSLVMALTLCLGHAFGALTWLMYEFQYNYFFLFVYFPLLAFLVIVMVRAETTNHEESDP